VVDEQRTSEESDSMGSFKEFLKEQEDRVRAEEATKEGKKKQWVASVDSLIQQMEAWLKEADPGGLLKLQTKTVERSEESIGVYDILALYIWLGSRVVGVEPVARDVMGPVTKPGDGSWSGRVDLVGPPYKFELYRFSGSNGFEAWYIRDTRNYRITPFEKEVFDKALVELFS
jgi:hypothetical protein